MKVVEIIPILKDISIFGGLEEIELAEVVSLIEIQIYKKGETIFYRDSPATAIYIIFDGLVSIVLNGGEVYHTITEFSVGDCFGETSMIGIQNHSTTAIAMEDTRLMLLSAHALSVLFKKNPRLFAMLILNIARESCRRLCQKNRDFLKQLQKETETLV